MNYCPHEYPGGMNCPACELESAKARIAELEALLRECGMASLPAPATDDAMLQTVNCSLDGIPDLVNDRIAANELRIAELEVELAAKKLQHLELWQNIEGWRDRVTELEAARKPSTDSADIGMVADLRTLASQNADPEVVNAAERRVLQELGWLREWVAKLEAERDRLLKQQEIDIRAARTLHPTANSVGDATVIAGAEIRRLQADAERWFDVGFDTSCGLRSMEYGCDLYRQIRSDAIDAARKEQNDDVE